MESKDFNLKRPTAKHFFDPLIKVLGMLTKFEHGVGIPAEDALDLVLEEVGISPATSPWPLVGSNPLGLYRIIGFAHRNQREDIKSARYAGRREATCQEFGRGIWGLTDAGIARSLELQGEDLIRIVPDMHPELGELDPEFIPTQGSEHDTRDDLTWVALELSRQGEIKVMGGDLETTLRRFLRVGEDHQIFVPATSYRRGDRVVTLQLMEGYAFIASGLDEVEYFALERSGYVTQVMSSPGPSGIRALHTIPQHSIDDMRRKLRGLSMLDVSPGDQVRVVEGKYAKLQMEVLYVEEEYVILQTTGLRSLSVITRLPKLFLALDKTEEDMWEEDC